MFSCRTTHIHNRITGSRASKEEGERKAAPPQAQRFTPSQKAERRAVRAQIVANELQQINAANRAALSFLGWRETRRRSLPFYLLLCWLYCQ